MCYTGGMTTDEELLAALNLRSDQAAVLSTVAAARGITVQQQLHYFLHQILEPWTEAKVHDQYHEMVVSHRNARKNAPIEVTWYGDEKYNQYRVRLCNLDNCTKPHVAKGLCLKHRNEADRDYSPALPVTTNSEGQRFDAAGVQICKNCDRKATYKTAGLCHADYQLDRLNKRKLDSNDGPTQV